MHLEIVTAERVVLSEEVDQINVSTRAGRIGVLPRHEPMLTILEPGELDIIKDGEVTPFAVSGGFMEVLATRVTILGDTVERSEEIDEARAEEARRRAEELLQSAQSREDTIRAEAELRRSMVRLRVAQLRGRRQRGG
jgi:F-type H+-transporting ATPase subunit epsilon